MAAKCDYRPALMNRRVTLQSKSLLPDGQGDYTDSWTDTATLWAQIEPAKGWERPYAGQLRTPITHKILIRYRAGLTTSMRLLFGARVLQIKEVINLEESNTYLRLMCIETN